MYGLLAIGKLLRVYRENDQLSYEVFEVQGPDPSKLEGTLPCTVVSARKSELTGFDVERKRGR